MRRYIILGFSLTFLLLSRLYNTVHNRHKTNKNINRENNKEHDPNLSVYCSCGFLFQMSDILLYKWLMVKDFNSQKP